MSHGPEHQIEHAEHASHAAHDPFDRRVTVSIAIVAAVLAGVTLMGHRAHNRTLHLQNEAIQFQSKAGVAQGQASDKWAEFQAQNIRHHMYGALSQLASVSAARSESEADKLAADWKKKAADYEIKLEQRMKEAKGFETERDGYQEKSGESLEESHRIHFQGDLFDYGELGLQLGVVLCSLAILTKIRGFWHAGLIGALAGLIVALVAAAM